MFVITFSRWRHPKTLLWKSISRRWLPKRRPLRQCKLIEDCNNEVVSFCFWRTLPRVLVLSQCSKIWSRESPNIHTVILYNWRMMTSLTAEIWLLARRTYVLECFDYNLHPTLSARLLLSRSPPLHPKRITNPIIKGFHFRKFKGRFSEILCFPSFVETAMGPPCLSGCVSLGAKAINIIALI